MKTAELYNENLDWAVATLEGYRNLHLRGEDFVMDTRFGYVELGYLNYSCNWELAGPIIESKKISVSYDNEWEYDPSDESDSGDRWYAELHPGHFSSYGPTPLIAAMRCYVASRLGDEIELQEGLK